MGLFASKKINLGEVINMYTGEVTEENGPYVLDCGVKKIDAEEMGNETRFINHLCRNGPDGPNCDYVKFSLGGIQAVAVVANCDIKAGVELTAMYATDFDKKRPFECHCPKCVPP